MVGGLNNSAPYFPESGLYDAYGGAFATVPLSSLSSSSYFMENGFGLSYSFNASHSDIYLIAKLPSNEARLFD